MDDRHGTLLPLTPGRWQDLEELFGPRGACGGCWCMWWRLSRSVYNAAKGDANRAALRAIVDGGDVPGILMYDDGQPIGWCSVAPRESFPVLARSRALPLIDDAGQWSVVCLFVRRDRRRSGTSVALLRAAAEYAAAQGATILEGYPVEPKQEAMPDAFAWTGTVSAFRSAGFTEAARGPTGRPIMRRSLA
ncbi:GNAT family N-acetyltransferase [Streptomyces sp. NPDC058678]|uniref:GNAT family N-acetyltransferase n=1 Tax=Streptomyces sp. NPDC058678 TaxID=3346595 RepID=UPI0036574D48